MVTPSERALGTFAATSVLALGMLGFARWALVTRPEEYKRWVPVPLLHTWSVGAIGLLSGYVFFALPFLILGFHAIALAGFALATTVIGLTGRDVVGWILDDFLRHRSERRSLFGHRNDCPAHKH